jgi:hypothetical protein
MRKKIDAEIIGHAIALADWQLKVRKKYDPIDADNKHAEMEQRILRQLANGPKTEAHIKKFENVRNVGHWLFVKALSSLKDSGEIAMVKQKGKSKTWAKVAE